MLFEESLWYKERLHYLSSVTGKKVLNIGSSTGKFRNVVQPHIQNNVFGILEAQGLEVIHVDQKAEEGVDLVGDLKDPAFMSRLRQMHCGAVFCNNLLMHLEKPERDGLIQAIDNIPPAGGLLYLSTAHVFPFTPDPHDAYYRPGIEEVLDCFPGYKALDTAIIESDKTFFKSITGNLKFGFIIAARLVTPFYHFRSWKYLIRYMPNLFRRYSAVCVILQKN